MSNHAAADQDALYYLYVHGDWAGPYQIAQIRQQVQQGSVSVEDYAYAASQQRHYTVEELLAARTPTLDDRGSSSGTSSSSNSSSTFGSDSGTKSSSSIQGMPALFDDIVDMAPQSSAAFDNVLPDLKAFYTAYLGLTEHTAAPQQALKDLHGAHQALIQELDHRRSDVGALGRIINEIDEVADYLANRHQLSQLWQLISEMEKVDLKTHTEDGVNSARAVLASLCGRAETQATVGESSNSSSVLLDLAGLEDEADSVVTRKFLLSARSEVASTKRDMEVLQQEIEQKQEEHAKDLASARKLLEKAEAARAEERHTTRQTAAEVRNLAAEIQRLASEPDIANGSDLELAAEVVRLGEELKTADVSTLAYMAEDVLIRMVAELRTLAAGGSGGDVGPLRADLARARESLTQAQAQVANLTSERDALAQQYEQIRIAAEKASERAKEREHRLRSTVTALEVTKELHQEVMEDLKSQLQGAQGRVEQMERDLANVRGEMKDSTGTVEARGKAIQHEMQRMVEMKAMLEVRSNELSESLKTAEDELAKAQSSQGDSTLAEALAAKVTQLRATFETTTTRLREQEANAERLTRDLEASRREAEELRGRGDSLSNELGEARGSLSAAKHRLDELNQAYVRLEAERESLHTELLQRKNTDTIHKPAAVDEHQTDRIERLERESTLLQRQLSAERRQGEQLAENRQQLENRITELATEREELRRKFEVLQNEHFNDHARHTAAIAVSTQAAIESERRLRELQSRVGDLEARLAAARKGTEGDRLEPTTVRISAQGNALESVEQENLRAELEQVARERDQVLAELETIRTSTTTSAATGIPEAVTKRLSELEYSLTAAKAEIVALDERHSQAVAERDRLRREAERLKGERESAAVEHRTALKSARDRLIETQERVATLERQASEQATGERDGQVVRGHLDQSLAEQERLSREVQRLAGELARINAAVPADRDQQLIGLARASHQLASEQEKVLVLTRSLMETLQQADSARGRTLELQVKLDQRTSERDQLQQELDRQRAQLTDLRLGLVDNQAARDDIPALVKRDQALAELDEVRKTLAETRARLSDTNRADSTLENLGKEQARIRDLEKELAALRSETDQRQQMFNEARARLVQVSSERDRLAAELAEIKSRPDQSAELKMLRRRLIRAKRQIKRLRRERDEALAERMKSATDLHQLTGQIERLKTSQRAAAEALGFTPDDSDMSLQQSGQPLHQGDTPTSRSGVRRVATPGGTSSVHNVTMIGGDSTPATPAISGANALQPMRSMTRRILTDGAQKSGSAFTSAFGKPAIPGLAAPDHGTPPQQTRLIPTGGTSALDKRPWRPSLPRIRNRMLLLATGTVVVVGLWSMLPLVLVPYSINGIVNAKLVRITAPIEGQFGVMKRQLHDQVEANEDLVLIRNDRADTSALDGLKTRLANANSGLNEDQRTFDEHRATERTLITQVAEYQRGLIAQLQRQLESEQRTLDALRDTLVHSGSDGALKAVTVQVATLDALSKRIERLQGGDLPDDEQPIINRRLIEVRQQLTTIKESLRAHAQTITTVQGQIVTEEAELARRRQAAVVSPITGSLWQRPSGGTPWVKQGDDILALVNPDTVRIEAAISKFYINDVVPGDQAEVLLIGANRRVTATVEVLEAMNLQGERNAAQLTAPATEQFRLVLSFDPETARTIPVGQKVRLVVTGQEPGLFRRVRNWISGLGKL